MLFYLIKLSFRTFFRLFYKVKLEGFENIPLGSPVIMAANHVSNFDPPLVGSFIGLRRDPIFIIKRELMSVPVVAWVMRRYKYIPIDRHKVGGDLGALKAALKVLKNGGSLFIFPEGSRSKTGEMGRAKAGIGFIAYYGKTPILPVKIIGTNKPPRFTGELKLKCGKPFEPKIVKDKALKEQFQDIGDEIMSAIANL
jgi:1-acyl-sn-glycerol-3-phosphate acyltransferase